MNWEKVGKISYQFGLSLIEWGFKLCALVAGMLSLATQGSFGKKLAAGFGSLSDGLRQLFVIPSTFKEISWATREYHRLGHAEFQSTYGMASLDQLIGSLNSFFTFFHQISVNLSQNPLISIMAALLVFIAFYLLGRVIRFARQRGRGSYLCRLEQRLGDRVFNREASRIKERVRDFSKRHSADKSMGRSSPKLT